MATPALRVTELTKDFGGLRAVDQVSFQVGFYSHGAVKVRAQDNQNYTLSERLILP